MNRPHNTELVLDPHVAQWAVRFIARVGGLYAVVIGLGILFGGRTRFAAPAYQVALHVPGAPWSWGVLVLVSGLTITAGTLIAKPRVTAAGAFLGTIWALMFSAPFALALIRTETANSTGVWSYLFIAVVFMVIAGVHYAMQPLPRFWPKRKATSAEA
jgi:hypothetical protein